jgi:hypothetical protein
LTVRIVPIVAVVAVCAALAAAAARPETAPAEATADYPSLAATRDSLEALKAEVNPCGELKKGPA